MARRTCTVRQLAAEAGLSIDDTILALLEAGLDYESALQTIWSRDLPVARDSVGLGATKLLSDPSEIDDLAARSNRPASEIRQALARSGVLKKRRLKRIPKRLLSKAEDVLGLRQPSPLGELKDTGADEGMTTAVGRAPERPRVKRKPKAEWPTIGPIQDLKFLTPTDVVDLHHILVLDFAKTKDPIDPPGVRSDALLESAVHRPRTALGQDDKYPTVAMAAAALLYGIVLDHPFHNGNKRTALVAMLVFLDKNGWVLTCDQDAIYDFLLLLADHKLSDRDGERVIGADNEVIHTANWLQGHVRKLAARELPLQFRHLRAILETYDCRLEHPSGMGNRVNIRRGHLQTQIAYRNEGTDVERNTVHKLRRDLELDDMHGYDSDIFYNRGPRIPEFINKYRKLLVRLAKV